MPCPKCEGSERKAIALGYWQCTSQVETIREFFAPIDAQGSMRPFYDKQLQACGNEYQEATAQMAGQKLIECWCGLYSIGKCRTCKSPLCGRHGNETSGGFLCEKHTSELAENQRLEQAAEAQRQARAKEEQQRVRRERGEDERFRDWLNDLSTAESLRQDAYKDAQYFAEAGSRASAADLVLRIKQLVEAVLSMKDATSFKFTVQSEWTRRRPRAEPAMQDPNGLGKPLSREWRQAHYGKHQQHFSVDSFNGVWPLLAWHTEWEGSWNYDRDETQYTPLGKSLWFNSQGVIRGGSLGNSSSEVRPSVQVYLFGGSPGETRSSTAYLYPNPGPIGPLSVDALTVDHLLPVVESALERPRLLTPVVAEICRGKFPPGITW